MNKIKSFTIVELVVGMLLSSIVLTVVFYTLMILNYKIKNYSQKTNDVNEYLLFRNILSRDWDNATEIKTTANGIVMYKKDQRETVQEYSFDTFRIIRRSNQTIDTFKIANSHTTLQRISDGLDLIKIFKCEISLNNQNIQFVIRKDYTALELMNAEKKRDDQ
jgi:competence protein ComGF